MKKAIISLSFLSLLIAATPVAAKELEVRGRDDDRTASVTERFKEVKDRVTERFEDQKASSTERRIEVQQNVAKKLTKHTERMLNATVTRFDKLISRLESRIAKVKAAGGDTSAAEGFLTQAKNELSVAKAKIAEFSTVSLTADKLSENVTTLRTIASEAKADLKQVQQSLSQATRALKPGEETASSTEKAESK